MSTHDPQLRDFFAAQAMNTLLQNRFLDYTKPVVQNDIAALAYQIANAMLKAREIK